MTTTTTTTMPVTSEDIIAAGRAISLTTTVVAEWAGRGTPKQREYLHGFLTAEHASRTHARHARLLKAARLPALKSFDGYDWTAIRFPDGYGRDQLTSLQFLDHAGDLVFYGDVGTGKTHCETCGGAYGPSRRRDASVGAGDCD